MTTTTTGQRTWTNGITPSLLVIVVAGLILGGCVSAEERARDEKRIAAMDRLNAIALVSDSLYSVDSVKIERKREAERALPTITYRTIHIADRGMLDSIHKAFDYGNSKSDAYKAFVTLNRRVFGSIHVGDTVVVPDRVVEDVRAYSVFPPVWIGADTISKIIVISNAMQSYAAYEKGKLVRFASCNTGTESKPTLPGRYAVNWKERLRISSLNDNWKLPFNLNFHLYAGNAFHQYYMPGRPASHSCVRQFADDAEWLFNWAETGKHNESGRVIPLTGTPVIIVDVFDFNRPKYGPWLDIASNREGRIELPENPMGVEEALIPISQIPPSVRGALPDRKRYEEAESVLRERGVIRPQAHLAPSIEYTKQKEAKARRAAASRAASPTPRVAQPPVENPVTPSSPSVE